MALQKMLGADMSDAQQVQAYGGHITLDHLIKDQSREDSLVMSGSDQKNMTGFKTSYFGEVNEQMQMACENTMQSSSQK